MDIKDFNIELIEDFSLFFNFAKLKFDKKMKTNNIKKQNKIRNWIYKNYVSKQEYPESIMKQLNTLCDKEFILFLESCSEFIVSNGGALEQQINKTCEEFPENVKKAFIHIFEREYYVNNDFKLSDDVLEIIVNSTAAYEEKLILFDAKYSEDKKFDTFCF
ncbi:MAG: hypothetical protein IKD04_08955 [Clostridia bacterium]|nr:hypothetical protein [Clostridia bacterium]